uniref:Retrotransposon gag domain-containing protein n=1 Tax=Phytophthora ramorum TaxID=164328 RepID=H3GBV3_PHYRM
MSTPTTSSSKTPAASATASAVVASKATTAAASATTATGIASTAMPTSAATESRLSVAGYHSRWHEKHAIRNKTGKIIAVETGVGIYSPGGEGVPLDYGSEVEEGELEGDKDTLSPGHTDPNVGLRRPREDDSNASSSKRSRSGSGTPLAAAGALTTPRDGDDSAPSAVVAVSHTESVREPWMPSQSEIGSRFGATAPPNLYALYSCNAIVDDDVAKRSVLDFLAQCLTTLLVSTATPGHTYEEFKEELKLAFEPPQNEFRSRAEFLDLQQSKHDVHAYAQRARYLVSNIVTNPIDEATKVVTFMKGLRDGPVKTYLFREYPNTLEAAIALAIQEEFSLWQAKLHVNAPLLMPRPMVRPSGGPEPMDLSSATAAGSQQRRGSTNRGQQARVALLVMRSSVSTSDTLH